MKITEELVRKKSEHNECLISTLEELSLHQEDIERIEHLHDWCRDLKILLLQSNLICKIENLNKLKKLEYINLAINNIERVENLEKLESLNKLDLTLNFIGELTSIESLRYNHNLRELILTGNPCCDYPNYREYVIGTLPQLQSLDCEEIKLTDKLQAKKFVHNYRSIIVQQQENYFVTRNEQKHRVARQKREFEENISKMDDEDARIKAFWDSKSEHCPETRNEIAKYNSMHRKQNNEDKYKNQKYEKPKLFAPCGRPYNLNQPKLTFKLCDEYQEYILDVAVYKYLDTSQIKVDVETNYVRITVKGKIFQLVFTEELEIAKASVQRSEITGHLILKLPKLNYNKMFIPTEKDKMRIKGVHFENKRNDGLTGCADIKNICSENAGLPDLI